MSPISLMNIVFCLKNGSVFISLDFYRMEVVGRLLGEAASQFGFDWITTSFRCKSLPFTWKPQASLLNLYRDK